MQVPEVGPLKFGIGQPVPRLEDPRLVTGRGRFTDDVNLPRQVYAAFFRSPYAHARIASIDTTHAKAASGVLAVYTGSDLAELGGLPCRAQLQDRHGAPCFIPHRPVLPTDRVRFVGQAVAAVIAESKNQAEDAAELIELEVDELPVSVDLVASALPEARSSTRNAATIPRSCGKTATSMRWTPPSPELRTSRA